MCLWCVTSKVQAGVSLDALTAEEVALLRQAEFQRWRYAQGKLSDFTEAEPGLVAAPGWWSRLDAGVEFARRDFKLVAADRQTKEQRFA